MAAGYGKLSPQRQRWPIPWYESDGGGTRGDQFGPQTNAKEFSFLCRDAAAKGCQGLLAIHWRSRDVEEAAAWSAQFAWEPKLSYEDFYRRFACKCFGPGNAEEMGEHPPPAWKPSDRGGPGGGGQSECGYFTWFEGNRLPKAEKLAALKQIRQRLGQIRHEMLAESRLEGLERLDWLIATIDWLTALRLRGIEALCRRSGGQAGRRGRALQRNGDAAGRSPKGPRGPPLAGIFGARSGDAVLRRQDDHPRRVRRVGHDQRQSLRRCVAMGGRDREVLGRAGWGCEPIPSPPPRRRAGAAPYCGEDAAQHRATRAPDRRPRRRGRTGARRPGNARIPQARRTRVPRAADERGFPEDV